MGAGAEKGKVYVIRNRERNGVLEQEQGKER